MAAANTTPVSLKLTAFVSLVVIQVGLALVYKAAQDSKGNYAFDTGSIMLVAELVKTLMSAAFFFSELRSKDPTSTAHTAVDAFKSQVTASPTLPGFCLGLAVLYCINNQFTFILLQWADAANFNLIKGGASVVATLMLRFGLGREFSSVQYAACALQCFGLITAQFGATCTNTPVLSSATYSLLLVSLTITSLCSVINEKLLKEHAPTTSFHAINVLMYTFGMLCNAFVIVVFGNGLSRMFDGYDRLSTYPVLFANAVIGIAVSAVYRYTDATMKTFGAACSTSILMMIYIAFYGMPFKLVVVMGCLTVFTATHLYATNAPKPSAAPKAADGQAATTPPAASTAGNDTLKKVGAAVFAVALLVAFLSRHYGVFNVPAAAVASDAASGGSLRGGKL